MTPKKGAPSPVAVNIPALDIRRFQVTLVGDSPLVVHKWSEKAKGMMRDKQGQKPARNKTAKVPAEDFWDSLYVIEGAEAIDRSNDAVPAGVTFGFPTIAFKSAAVDACSHVEGITKVEARGAFHIIGELARIDGSPSLREDMVRISMGTADLRYRGEFKSWRTTLDVRFNAGVLSVERIVNLFNTAGFAIGVGEHRPQKDGSWGMFHVATNTEG